MEPIEVPPPFSREEVLSGTAFHGPRKDLDARLPSREDMSGIRNTGLVASCSESSTQEDKGSLLPVQPPPVQNTHLCPLPGRSRVAHFL